jgi:organic hydroperoxide reductase OsmC/OhrA
MLYTVDQTWSPAELLAAYERSPDLVREAIKGMDRAALIARPIADKWSSLEVVCHLADTEIYFVDRIERTLAHDNPLLLGVDERPYADRLQFQQHDAEEELALMTILRQRTARILRRQPADVWNRTAVHSERGKVTLRQMVEGSIGHVLHHLPFIAEKRSAMGLDTTPAPTPQKAWPEFRANITWSNTGPDFARGKYSRRHRWSFDGGIAFDGSASPHVVPSPWSAEDAVDPEEALVAAAASCHMLTFLWLASKAGYLVDHYQDDAVGAMEKHERRQPFVSRISLYPRITWGSSGAPDPATLARLHDEAHEQCFIANSIKCLVVVCS